jgi:rubredoxin
MSNETRQLWKCQCGWVHAEVSIDEVMATPKDPEMLARYTRCARCGAPSSGFQPASHSDVPPLATQQSVVIAKDQKKGI